MLLFKSRSALSPAQQVAGSKGDEKKNAYSRTEKKLHTKNNRNFTINLNKA